MTDTFEWAVNELNRIRADLYRTIDTLNAEALTLIRESEWSAAERKSILALGVEMAVDRIPVYSATTEDET